MIRISVEASALFKETPILHSLVLLFMLSSCSNEAINDHQHKILYYAVNRFDTAKLSIDLTDKVFEGQFEINHRGVFKDSGDVNGVVKGDTLMGTFHYQSYGVEKWYRIPIALLKKDKKLIMGVGSMEIYMNMTFFTKNTPIDYEHPQFTFQKAE